MLLGLEWRKARIIDWVIVWMKLSDPLQKF